MLISVSLDDSLSNHSISELGELYHRYIDEPVSTNTIYNNLQVETFKIASPVLTHESQIYECSQPGSHAIYWISNSIQEVVIEDTCSIWRLWPKFQRGSFTVCWNLALSIGSPALQTYWSLMSMGLQFICGSTRCDTNKLKRSDRTMWLFIDLMDHCKEFTNLMNEDTLRKKSAGA
ncbi:unnamed protein product [Ambrosiozyma monospora]|uniref:Unnamed protein product n=1 Tax=Ambrosiozyma monospora TaxID=43982 RepID=A0ACB5STL6_AMBMO|nr:unnamed protein product [Ambrosiozyma monospora]